MQPLLTIFPIRIFVKSHARFRRESGGIHRWKAIRCEYEPPAVAARRFSFWFFCGRGKTCEKTRTNKNNVLTHSVKSVVPELRTQGVMRVERFKKWCRDVFWHPHSGVHG